MKIDILHRNEGGPSRAKLIRSLKRAGYKAKARDSRFRYHTGIEVPGKLSATDKRRIRVIVFGPEVTVVRQARARGRR